MKEMSTGKKLLIMRALHGLAWADGHVDEAELAFIERVTERFHFSEVDCKRLHDMLEKPVDNDEAERLLRDVARGVLNRRERLQLVEELRSLAGADGEMTERERSFIASIATTMTAHGALVRLLEIAGRKEKKP